jgi:vancomycin resistance protein VanJ
MSQTDNTTFVVMTYNVGNGLVTPAKLVRGLLDSGADIIGIQELASAQADAIVAEVAEAYPFQIVRGTGFSGKSVLSRYPITGHEWIELSPGRPDLRVVVSIGGIEVTIFDAHPPPPRFGRRGVVFDDETLAQLEQLSEVVRQSSPGILVGDLNMTARHPSYARWNDAGLVDAYRSGGVGRGATFPQRPGRIRHFTHPFSWLPLPAVARVDYIWHTQGVETIRSWVGAAGGSDHRPVFAELSLSLRPDRDSEGDPDCDAGRHGS